MVPSVVRSLLKRNDRSRSTEKKLTFSIEKDFKLNSTGKMQNFSGVKRRKSQLFNDTAIFEPSKVN